MAALSGIQSRQRAHGAGSDDNELLLGRHLAMMGMVLREEMGRELFRRGNTRGSRAMATAAGGFGRIRLTAGTLNYESESQVNLSLLYYIFSVSPSFSPLRLRPVHHDRVTTTPVKTRISGRSGRLIFSKYIAPGHRRID